MNTNTNVLRIKAPMCIAAVVATCAAFSIPVQAMDHEATIQIPVSFVGLDLTQPADAHKFYQRIKNAAFVACARGNRVGLEPVAVPAVCYEKAIGDAVRSVNLSQLTMIYLKTHTLDDAKTRGINIPVLMAAK